MAITNIKPIHISTGATIKNSIKKNIEYITSDEKTNDGEYVSCYVCSSDTAPETFALSKKIYLLKTGRSQKNDVLAYSVVQSFNGTEVTPEVANEIGYKLAEKLTGGNHAFIVATHVNTDNIHNHITWNSTNLDCNAKWKDVKRSGKDVAKISDELCLEYNLSVIENKKTEKEFKHYGEWEEANGQRELSFKKKLQQAIDEGLLQQPKNFDEFLFLMFKKGFEVKQGKHIAFKNVGQKRFTRLRSLGYDYSEEQITLRLSKKKNFSYDDELNFMMDISKIVNKVKELLMNVGRKNQTLKNSLAR